IKIGCLSLGMRHRGTLPRLSIRLFCRGAVEDRVKNAAQDPTFLMAPVAIVTAYKCFNMHPVKLEQLLHRFFGEWCLNVDVTDKAGKRHVPREWFTAPLDVIEQAIQ